MARKSLKEIAKLDSKRSNTKASTCAADFFREQFIVVSLVGSPKAMKNAEYKRLLIINDLDENQWFIHVSWLPGGDLTMFWSALPHIVYKKHIYVPFTAVEQETGERLDNIRAIALKNISEKFSPA